MNKIGRLNGYISKLFYGTIINYINCLDIKYTSERKETFSDIILNVRGNKNIYQALE